jgi:hypothetical protein
MSVTNLFDDTDPTLANRYLAGQLTDAERTAFEAELERNGATLQELEATARLKVGLERLRETGELEHMLRPTSTTRQILVGLAAGLAVTVIAASFLVGYFRQPASAPLLAAAATSFVDVQGSALSVATTVAVFRKRAGDYDAVIELPPARSAIEIRVLPELGAALQRYRVSLARMRDDGPAEPAELIAGLRPAEDGFVTVFADSARLSPGRYRLAVAPTEPNAGSAAPETFMLQVVPAPQGRSN